MRAAFAAQVARVLTCVVAGAGGLAPAGAAQRVAIRAARVIDPVAGTAAAQQTIVVEGTTIVAIGRDVVPPPGTPVINLGDLTVLPGLFDAHTHLCSAIDREWTGQWEQGSTLAQTTAYRALRGVKNAKDVLAAGFTTVRDVGNAGNYADTELRRAIEAGIIDGPTIINAGRIIAPYGGQYSLQPERPDLGEPEYLYADTHDEIRKAVRANVQFGATVIKIVVDDQPYIYTVADIKHFVAEAAAAGVRVAAHALTERGARNAALGGVASIEHGFEMSDETLRLAKTRGVYLVPTDFTEKAWLAYGGTVERARTRRAAVIDRLRRAHHIGVPMAFGTDLIFTVPDETRGTWGISFVQNFVDANIPPADALRVMITNPAELLGVADRRGILRPGFAADIIATKGNPLDDIRALMDVQFVMKDGKVIHRPDTRTTIVEHQP